MTTLLPAITYEVLPALENENRQLDSLSSEINELQIITEWLANVKESTRKQYVPIVKQFFGVIGKNLIDCSKGDVLTFKLWLESQNYAIATIKNKIAVIKSLFSHCYQIGYIKLNICYKIKTENPENNLLKKTPDDNTLTQFFGVIENENHKLLFTLCYSLGLRISECVNLEWDDINGDRIHIFGKGSKTRDLAIPNFVLEMIKKEKIASNSKFIFANKQGKNITRVYAHKLIKKYGKLAGCKDFSCHDLRHFCATNALKNGKQITDIQKFLGHSSIVTTNRYLDAFCNNDFSDVTPVF